MIFFATLVMGEDRQAAASSLGCSSPNCLFPRTRKLCPTIGSFVEGDQKGPGKKVPYKCESVFAHTPKRQCAPFLQLRGKIVSYHLAVALTTVL